METVLNKDEKLWAMAQRMAKFKRKLFSFITVNTFLWIIWILEMFDENTFDFNFQFPWPLYCTIWWGLSLALKYYNLRYNVGDNLVEKEYEKLKKKTYNWD